MIELRDLYALIESNFEFLMAVDEREQVVHASRLLGRACGSVEIVLVGRHLEEILTPRSLDTFRSAILPARDGGAGTVVYTPAQAPDCSIPLKLGFVSAGEGGLFLLFGTLVDGLSRVPETEKDERVKELFCIYSVAEWIEVSASIRDFFMHLPEYLQRGMQYPDRAVVYSVFQGVEYGQKLATGGKISSRLVVNRQVAGQISVGYVDESLELLPEEQRMLSEIARMLSLALERKELAERLTLKHEEEEQYRETLAKLEQEIEARSHELEEQRKKLGAVDSYLSSATRSWEESRARLEAIFAAIPDRMAMIDRQRNVIMTNKKDVDEGHKCHKAFFHRDRPCEDCRLARIVRDRTPITLTIQDDDRYLEVHALPIFNQDHEVDGIMEFYRDVTLEKTYAQQLQQADQMASLGQLVSGIGHEINNPNQFIRGNVKILKQALEDMLPIVDAYQQQHPDLRIARLPYSFFRQHVMTLIDDMGHGSERIKAIVEGLKRFARRDEGLLIDKVDVNTAIEACTRLVHNEVHKTADIKLELDPNVPVFVGNSHKIEQVLVNLIVNAAQAMPDDRRGLITVRSRCEDDHVVVQVEDNGKGMNEKTIKQIFDPFFTTKRAKGGSGLGLAIAYRILEEHNGTITVKSEPGAGTTFTIRIPVRPGNKPSAEAEAVPAKE
jgi:signal transduction histidine kinase